MCNMLDESDWFIILHYGKLFKIYVHCSGFIHDIFSIIYTTKTLLRACFVSVLLVFSEGKPSRGWLPFLLSIHLLDFWALKLAIKGRTSKWHYSGSQACCPSGSKMKVSLEDSLMSTNEICFLCLAGCRLVYYRRCCSRATISLGYTSAETSLAAWLITCARKQSE